jgi:hypothetical protein
MTNKPPTHEQLDGALQKAGFRADLSDEEQVRQAMLTLKRLVAKLAAWTKA